MSDNTKKAQYIHCFHFFSKDSNSTLKNHISHPHCKALKRAAKPRQSSMYRDGSLFVYNSDVLREQFAGLARSDPSLSSEYERYVHSDFVTHLQTTEFKTFDVLGFWKAKETMFPILSRMAMDILSIQATSVASKSAFSTSGRVLSIQNKTHSGILDAEVHANEAIPLFDEEIALDTTSSEGSMSGPSSGGEEAEAEANYGADNRPSMLEKDMYDSWKSRMELYMLNRPHGRMILESVEQGPLIWPTVEVEGVTRLKKYSELSIAEAIQADCDVKATNIILQGLPPEVYAL
nr:zinc finger BED domain-containing protein RICESLEEPER 2-like [Tanacetum cinerariifolium]